MNCHPHISRHLLWRKIKTKEKIFERFFKIIFFVKSNVESLTMEEFETLQHLNWWQIHLIFVAYFSLIAVNMRPSKKFCPILIRAENAHFKDFWDPHKISAPVSTFWEEMLFDKILEFLSKILLSIKNCKKNDLSEVWELLRIFPNCAMKRERWNFIMIRQNSKGAPMYPLLIRNQVLHNYKFKENEINFRSNISS